MDAIRRFEAAQPSHWPRKLAAAALGLTLVSATTSCSASREASQLPNYEFIIGEGVVAPDSFEGSQVLASAVAADNRVQRKVNSLDAAAVELMTVESNDGNLVVTKLAEGVNRKQVLPLEAAISTNASWLHAAMNDGGLQKIQFNFQKPDVDKFGPDGFMQYIEPQSGDETLANEGTLLYELPTTTQVSTELITTMLRHEAGHALAWNLSVSDILPNSTRTEYAIVDVDAERYTELCTDLRKTALDEAAPQAFSEMDTLNEMLDAAPNKEWSSTIIAIRRSLANGTYDKFQAEQGEANGLREYVVQACRVDNPEITLYRTVEHDPLNGEHPEIQEIATEMYEPWFKTIGDNSLYTLLRENTYLETEANSDDMGHPYDNLDELMASFLTVSTLYPEQVKSNIAALPVRQQDLLKDLLQVIGEDITAAHMNQPAFVEEVQSAVRTIVSE